MAIQKEIEAHDFYMKLHGLVASPDVKQTLQFLANEEIKHRDFLIKYRDSGSGAGTLKPSTSVDYKIAEYLQEPDVSGNMESKDAYLIAAHRELGSYNFYKSLADAHPAGEIKNMLLKMASEEMKHKEQVEYLYANTAFGQTAGG